MAKKEDKAIYGVAQDLFDSRVDVDQSYVDSVKNALDILIDEASQFSGWDTFSVNEVKKRFNFDTKISVLYLTFQFMNHPNIITRNGTKKGNSLRAPIAYKYVSTEEKVKLGFYALYYKKIDNDLLAYLTEQIGQDKYEWVNSILCVLNYLVTYNADKGWIQLPAMRIAARTGMMLNDVIDTLDILVENHVVCLHHNIRQLRHSKRSIAIAIAKSKADYARLSAEADDANALLYESEEARHKEDEISRVKEALAQRLDVKINKEKSEIGLDLENTDAIIESRKNRNISSAYESVIKELMDEIVELKNEIIKLKTENRILSAQAE